MGATAAELCLAEFVTADVDVDSSQESAHDSVTIVVAAASFQVVSTDVSLAVFTVATELMPAAILNSPEQSMDTQIMDAVAAEWCTAPAQSSCHKTDRKFTRSQCTGVQSMHSQCSASRLSVNR